MAQLGQDSWLQSSARWQPGRGAAPSPLQSPVLTHSSQRGAPEELVELGQVEHHAELVGLPGRAQLLARGHRWDPELLLGHVERQLVVPHHVILLQRLEVTGAEWE